MEQQLIHPQTYTLLKGKQPPSYYATQERRVEKANQIIETVAKFFGFTKEELIKKNRSVKYVCPRQIAVYLVKTKLKISDQEVADIIKRDRTTVIYSVNYIKDVLYTNQQQNVIQWINDLKILI